MNDALQTTAATISLPQTYAASRFDFRRKFKLHGPDDPGFFSHRGAREFARLNRLLQLSDGKPVCLHSLFVQSVACLCSETLLAGTRPRLWVLPLSPEIAASPVVFMTLRPLSVGAEFAALRELLRAAEPLLGLDVALVRTSDVRLDDDQEHCNDLSTDLLLPASWTGGERELFVVRLDGAADGLWPVEIAAARLVDKRAAKQLRQEFVSRDR